MMTYAAAMTFGKLMTSPVMKAWTIDNFLHNLQDKGGQWGGLLIAVIGTFCVVWMFVQMGMKFMGSQHGPNHMGWPKIIIGLCIGSAMMIGGWSLASNVATGLNDSVNAFGEQS